MNSKHQLSFVHPVLGEAPGHFVALTRGVTHFNIFKPSKPVEPAKYVFCGHGLGGNLRDYNGIGQTLADKGYTVVTYDYYGRGWSRIDSDEEHVVWDEDLYYQQAIGLWTTLGLKDTPFIWLGYSTGGTVGVLLASRQPKLAYKRATLTYWFDGTSEGAKMAKSRVSASIHQYPPYMESIQSTCLHLFSNPSLSRVLKDYKMLSQRVLLIWGRGDTTTPFQHSETLAKLKTAELVVLDEAKHGVLIERQEEVRAAIVKFIDQFENSASQPNQSARSSNATPLLISPSTSSSSPSSSSSAGMTSAGSTSNSSDSSSTPAFVVKYS